ncbi:MAG: hypothetical protein NTU93_00080 [Arthrobacter sp.]|nr:hypothetical protein [Arthrobacter sp.]
MERGLPGGIPMIAALRRYLPRWRAVALVAAALAAGCLIGAASRPDAPTAATVAQGGIGARYQVATQPGYGWACVVAWDQATGQAWVYDRERREWTELPALPERSEP